MTGHYDVCQANEITDLCEPNNPATKSALRAYLGQTEAVWEYNIESFFVGGVLPDTCEYDETAYIFVSYECHHPDGIQEGRYD